MAGTMCTRRCGGRRHGWIGVPVVGIVVFILCFLSSVHVSAYQLTVDKSECIFEEINREGDFVSGSFVVYGSEQGWASEEQGMDVQVTAPNGYSVYSQKKKTEDQFFFHATKKGAYKFCFTNHAPYPEIVVFNLHVGHHLVKDDIAKDDHFIPLLGQITSLEEALEQVYSEQVYLRSRDFRHQLTSESTNKRLIIKAIAEAVALIATSGLQVYLLRRLFEKRLKIRV